MLHTLDSLIHIVKIMVDAHRQRLVAVNNITEDREFVTNVRKKIEQATGFEMFRIEGGAIIMKPQRKDETSLPADWPINVYALVQHICNTMARAAVASVTSMWRCPGYDVGNVTEAFAAGAVMQYAIDMGNWFAVPGTTPDGNGNPGEHVERSIQMTRRNYKALPKPSTTWTDIADVPNCRRIVISAILWLWRYSAAVCTMATIASTIPAMFDGIQKQIAAITTRLTDLRLELLRSIAGLQPVGHPSIPIGTLPPSRRRPRPSLRTR